MPEPCKKSWMLLLWGCSLLYHQVMMHLDPQGTSLDHQCGQALAPLKASCSVLRASCLCVLTSSETSWQCCLSLSPEWGT